MGVVSRTADIGAAADALASFRASSGNLQLASKPILIREVRYSFRELSGWRDLVFDHVLLRLDEVVSLDLDESANSVDVGITEKADREQIEAVLEEIGVPLTAVRFETKQPTTPGSHVTLLHNSRPVRGGFEARTTDQSGTPYATCSLGFNARKLGKDLVFTNSHCTAELWDLDGGRIYQDDRISSELLGYEDMDPDADTCGIWPFSDPCRYSDAAAFEYMPGEDFDFGFIARPTGSPATQWGTDGSRVINHAAPRFRIIGADDPPDGGDVEMVGIASGWTAEEVRETCEDRGSGEDDGVRLCQMIASYYSSDGDSGAPVFIRAGQDVVLKGINWGYNGDSTSTFSPWSGLVADFGSFEVALDPISVGVSVQDTGAPYSSVTATAVVQYGVPPFTYSWKINGSSACGNQSTCQGQLGGPGTYTTFKVTVTDATSDQDTAQKSVLAEFGGCPACPLLGWPSSGPPVKGGIER